MTFEEKKNQWYYRYWLSDDNQFAIAIEKMLFNRIRIQVLHNSGEEEPKWVIQEYPTYTPELVYPLIFEIMKSLEDITCDGRDWWLVFEKLPPRKKKYLEDVQEDPAFARGHKNQMENAKRLKNNHLNKKL